MGAPHPPSQNGQTHRQQPNTNGRAGVAAQPPANPPPAKVHRPHAQGQQGYTREEIIRAVADVRDERLAHFIAMAFTLAAETHPDVMKKAMSTVFDLSYFENAIGRYLVILSDIQAKVAALKADLVVLEDRQCRKRT